MIRVLHGRASTFSMGFVVLYLVLISIGTVVFVPLVTMSIRYFNHDPGMSILGLIGAAGWIASMIWFARTLRIKS